MSWKNFTCMGSGEKARLEGSEKFCCCGGHNLNNVKKNLHHSGTRRRLAIRRDRQRRSLEKLIWINYVEG